MKKLLITAATLICLLTFSGLALAQSIDPKLFPANQGFITDEANIISSEDEAELNSALQNLQTTKQIEIAVVSVSTLHDYPIEDFALDLGRHWGVGQKDTNTGVVFLTAPNERQTRIEVGYGLEGQLTDAESFAITQDLLPYFRNNDYSQGIKFGTQQIIASLDGEYISQNPTPQSSPFESIQLIIFFIIFGLSWSASILARSKSWHAGGILGGVGSGILSFVFSLGLFTIPIIIIFTIAGLLFDRAVSKAYQNSKRTPWWAGGGGHDSSGGFFGGGGGSSSGGGFSGGSFGGGGSTGRW